MTPPTLGIQVVLFDDDVGRLHRLGEAVAASVAHAVGRGVISGAAVRLGDSSAVPCLGDDDVATLRSILEPGVDAVTYRHFGDNLGSGGGSNALAEGAIDDVLLVLNPDTYPAPGLVAAMVAAVADPTVGAADARQIPIEHPKVGDPATGDTDWVSGSCLMIRREVFEQVGGFDDHFFPLYCDDVDLSWRLRLAGFRTVHVPEAVLFHDKLVDPAGRVRMSEHAVYSDGLARLFLSRRYGAPEIEAQFLAWADAHGTPAHHRAAAEFRERLTAGDVPDPLQGAAEVARFEGNVYGRHRFGYDVVAG